MFYCFFRRKAEVSRLGEEVIFYLPELPFAIAILRRLKVTSLDEGAYTAASLEDSSTFEFGIYLCDCIGINFEIDGEAPNRGQLIADGELAGRYAEPDGPLQLMMKRHRMLGLDVKRHHTNSAFISNSALHLELCFSSLYYCHSTIGL